MKEKIKNVISCAILGIGLICNVLFAITKQSTKSWETFIPNISIMLGITIVTFVLIILVNQILKK